MSEAPEVEVVASEPAVRRAASKRKRRAAPKRADKPSDEFSGLSAGDCPTACRVGHCVITGDGFCGHPRKGGLQGAAAHDKATIERFTRAQKALAHARIDRRG